MTTLAPSQAVAAALAECPTGPLAVAVSGGGDSMALLHLAAGLRAGCHLEAVTVDHGLRSDSGAEAEFVAQQCATLKVPHTTLRWEGWDGSGNIQQEARRARRKLISTWAKSLDASQVMLGHTAEDQAETFLLRLARGSGVYGLSGMAARVQAEGVTWLRPLLQCHRADLREILAAKGVPWMEDPSNENTRFDRVRLRQAMPMLADLGLTVDRLTDTAQNMDRAAQVVRAEVSRLARQAVLVDPAGLLTLNTALIAQTQAELRLRLLSGCLRWVSSAEFSPRREALEALAARVCAGSEDRQTLSGCLIDIGPETTIITREAAHVGPPVAAGQLWDSRWTTACDMADVTVSALGPDGLAALKDWRASGLSRETLMGLPAFWREKQLIAVPFAMPLKGCHVALAGGTESFFSSLMPR